MAVSRVVFKPGVNTQATPTTNKGGWSSSGRVRWKDGFLQKLGGWARLFSNTTEGTVRALHAYEDLTLTLNLGIGTDNGLQVWFDNTLQNVSLVSNFGTVAVGGIVPTATTTTATVAQTAHGYVAGDQIYLTVPFHLGGFVFYPQIVTVASVVGPNSWRFANSVPFPAATPNSPISFEFFVGTKVTVDLAAHGLSVGDTLSVPYYVGDYTLTPSPTRMQPGTYTVTHVTSSSFFDIVGSVYNTSDSGAFLFCYDSAGHMPVYKVATPPFNPENWFLDNLGQNMTVSYTGTSIYLRSPPQAIAVLQTNAPTASLGSFVAMPQAQIIAFGASVLNTVDPLLLAWSDAGNSNVWTASATNQAGTYHLSRGSTIRGGIQAPQTTLIWTDIDLWSMKYVGPPFVYSFYILASGAGMVAPKARATLGRNTYWVNQSQIMVYGDQGAQAVPCDVWDVFFGDLDADNVSKIFAVANSSFQEVMFFYPSASGGSGECDKYIKVYGPDNLWDYGDLDRSAMIDQSVFGSPIGADPTTNRIQQHEIGYDADGSAMTGVFAETGFMDLGDGADIVFIDQIIPDFKWFGEDGSINLTVYALNYPAGSPVGCGPFSITPQTRYIRLRARARQIAFRLEWAATTGFSARLGTLRTHTQPSGRRP